MAINNKGNCNYEFNVKTVGGCDVSRLNIDGTNRQNLNWTEISVPEILCVPAAKPDIEGIDQVYINVVLENIKLIETPFAYRKYVSFSFYNSVQGLLTTLPPLVTALGTAIANLLVPIEGILITTLDLLITTLTPVAIIVPALNAVITLIQEAKNVIADLVSSIQSALTDVTTAAAALLAAIAAVPFSADIVCAAIQALITALNALQTIVNSVLGILQGLIDGIQAAINAIAGIPGPALIVINGIIDDLQDIITLTIAPLVPLVITAITNILNILAPINCTSATVIVLIPNAEGTCLSGRKLILEGILKQKVVYTAEVAEQSVHSAHYEIPFISYIIPYANFEGAQYQEGIEVYDPVTDGPITVNGYSVPAGTDLTVNLNEEFVVDTCVEDIYVYAIDPRTIFKNVTLFLKATPKLVTP